MSSPSRMIHTCWRAPVSAQRARTEREGVANAVSDAAGEVPSATIGSARPANGSAVSREARCGCGAATLRPATRLRRGNPAHSERSALEHPKRSDTGHPKRSNLEHPKRSDTGHPKRSDTGHSERRATESSHTQQTHLSPLDALRSHTVSCLVSDPTPSRVQSHFRATTRSTSSSASSWPFPTCCSSCFALGPDTRANLNRSSSSPPSFSQASPTVAPANNTSGSS